MTDDDDRDDPGPHTHCYVGTDQGDECEICGQLSNQFADLGDEWDIDWDGYQDADEPIGPQLPEYDFEGGVQ
jgi:hypothetical protein